MVRERTLRAGLAFGLIVLVACALGGCGSKTQSWGDTETGLILRYGFPEDDALAYRMTNDFSQTLEVRGRSVTVGVNTNSAYSLKLLEVVEDNYRLSVTVDTMSIVADSPEGNFEADLSGAVGQSFEMTMTPLGEELEVTTPDDMEYSMGPGGTRNAASAFQTLFSNVPERPLIPGDTWTSEEKIIEESDAGDMIIAFDVVHTLDGYETIEGIDCARIASAMTGTVDGTGAQQGVEWVTEGEIEGAGTWYFAYKKGHLVREVSEITGTGTTTAAGAEGDLTIPLSWTIMITNMYVP